MQFTNIDELRTHRDDLLAESDKWFLPDFPLTLPEKTREIEAAWKIYRQQLRDWPAAEENLAKATVPAKPPV